MKYYFFTLVTLLLSLNCLSQINNSKIIEFSTLEHNFGTLRKNTGEVKYSFQFINKGTLPVSIDHIDSDCECTTTSWSKEPIAPGNKGTIMVYFNPDNLNGNFSKKITVKSNAINSDVALILSGNVIYSEEKEVYQYSVGELGMKSKHINLGIIKKGEIKTKTMNIINNSDVPLKIEFQEVPSYIKLGVEPKILKPDSIGNIYVEYNSEIINDWDYIIDRITVLLNGKKNNKNKLAITSNIVEDFSKYTPEQLQLSPVASYFSTIQLFDTLKSKKTVDCKFLLKNEGKSDLVIRDVNPSCGCTAVSPEKKIIPPGDSTYIDATFNPKGKVGDFNYSITVIANDPKNNRQFLWIKGFIKN